MVYVDNFEAPYRGMIMSHMVADITEELLQMADKIGVQRKWIQHPGTKHEHFDVCLSKKMKAVQYGAKPIGMRELASFCMNRTVESLTNPIISHQKSPQ